ADPYRQIDPYWLLLHEPAVIDELELSDSQDGAYHEWLGELDLRFFPLRNKSRDEAVAGVAAIVAEAKQRLPDILTPGQIRRLNQILLWRLGTDVFSDEKFTAKLDLNKSQRERVRKIID